MKDIDKLQKLIDESNYIVFFGGAGVSTSSGIPDYRSKDGLYNQKFKYPPEIMLSSGFFYSNTEEFYKFYKDKFNVIDYKPNIVHTYLYELEKRGKLKAIVTQNIDGLHTKAGNKNVYELHGTVYKYHCIKCNKEYGPEYVFSSKGVPLCECGGIIKPNVVLYGESLDESYNEALYHISKADLLIVAGTSLNVYPAAGMLDFFRGKHLVIINKTPTSYDYRAELVLQSDMKRIFEKLK